MQFIDVYSDFYDGLMPHFFLIKSFEAINSNFKECRFGEVIYIYRSDRGIEYVGKTNDLYNRMFLDTHKDFYKCLSFKDLKVAFLVSENTDDLYKTLIKELKPYGNKKKYKNFNKVNTDDLELYFAPLADFVSDMQRFVGVNQE